MRSFHSNYARSETVRSEKITLGWLLLAVVVCTLLASVAALLALAIGPAQGAVTLPSGFTQSPVVGELTGPTDMEFAPDGRLFILEEQGLVRIAKPDGTLGTFLDISTNVDSEGERGLLGIAFDPAFSTNRWVYLHYTRKTTSTTPVHNRIVRVTANAAGDSIVPGSEKLIFRLNNLSSATNHNGGSIDFRTDNKLYIAAGDNAVGANAQSLSNLKGKILRINKTGTIPEDNPFYSSTTGNNRAIWALGLRNPFKFAFQPGTGAMFINDVGESTWEEINRGTRGFNYGWNFCEGNHDNPGRPGSVNCSAAPYTAPVHEYTHGSTNTTGCSITGGTFYNPTTVQFPSGYVGDYFFADLCNGWIRTYDPSSKAATGFATGLSSVVDLEVSKNEGELYYLSRGSPGTVSKIRHTGP